MWPLSLPFTFQRPGRGPVASAAREAGKCRPASWPRAEEEEDSLGGRPAELLHLPSVYKEKLGFGQTGFSVLCHRTQKMGGESLKGNVRERKQGGKQLLRVLDTSHSWSCF